MSNVILHYDIETKSACDLKSAGVFRYAEHPTTAMHCLGYRFGAEPVITLWVPYLLPTAIVDEVLRRCKEKHPWLTVRILDQVTVPEDLREHIEKRRPVRAHNNQFERVVMNGVAGEKLNFPKVKIEQTHCTMAKCAANGIPQKLEDAAKALKTHLKDEGGRFDMLALAKPRKPTKANPDKWWTIDNAPEKFCNLYCYNIDDVLAEYGVDEALPDLSDYELQVYHLDQRINARGEKVDLAAIDDVQCLIQEYKEELAAKCEELTRPPPTEKNPFPTGLKPTQRDKLAEWIRTRGEYPALLDMQAETVKDLVKSDAVPKIVKRVLSVYSTYNAKAVSKYEAMVNAVCSDGRLRGMYRYHGAGPGRWSALIVQLQNLFRPVIEDCDSAIEAFTLRDLEFIRWLFSDVDPMKVFSSTVRGMLIPEEDSDLLFLDYAGIEARLNAWLFDEEWKLEAYRLYDTFKLDEHGKKIPDGKGGFLRMGPDLYVVAYARAFGVPVESVTKAQRQVGKVMELALGYEGGVGAFVTMVDTYGIDLEELARAALPNIPEEIKRQAQKMWDEMPQRRAGVPHHIFIACDSLKRLWRRAHPKIKQGWRDLKEAGEMSVQNPGAVYSLPNGKISFEVIDYKGRKWQHMRLPSGRKIAYYNPEWIPEVRTLLRDAAGNVKLDEWDRPVEEVIPGEMRYWGIDTKTRRFMRVSTYGGRRCENADQGMAACVLRAGMFAWEEADYPVIGTVHDELKAEIPVGFGSMEEASALLVRKLHWAPGLPLAVEGHRRKRYGK